MSTIVFPGQGTQSKGMGGALFDEFSELVSRADAILGYSIKELCLADPYSNLSQTQYTQPALYIVNALSYIKKIIEEEMKPDFVAGHSLGEYNALFAAGAFDFETGLKLVKKRGELMGRVVGGGMAAVIGLTMEQIDEVLKQHDLNSIDIANLNSPSQIVISGPQNSIERAKDIFENIAGVRLFSVLKTSGAFHSRYMEEARKEFENFVNSFEFRKLDIPVISNFTARPYKQFEIRQNLINQITSPVKWSESIRYLMGCGEKEFEEIGTGRVLTGLIQRIKAEAEPLLIEAEQYNQYEETPSSDFITVEEDKVSLTDSVLEPEQQSGYEAEESKCYTDNTITEVAKPQRVLTDIVPSSLGSVEFKKDYNLKYAYLTGGMYHGIASKEMVVEVGKAGMMGFLGTGGVEFTYIRDDISYIKSALSEGQTFGINITHNHIDPEKEEKVIDLLLSLGVNVIEASAFLTVTPALIRYRAKGLKRGLDGKVISNHKLIAKVSRPEIAATFMSPAPERLLDMLHKEGKITSNEAAMLKEVPVADDICAEADSGGHTDGGVAYAMMPAMIKLRDELMKKYNYHKNIRIGAAGGIGTPEAAAAAFILGADFIMTGSINQCTVEASTSDAVKELLQQINIQDTDYAPAGDMFELGAKAQVLKKGVFFPIRANKLYDLYRLYDSIDDIDEKTKMQIQDKYFKRSFATVYENVKSYYPPQEIEQAEKNPKYKMALIFRWYFGYSSRLALNGSEESKVDYQIHCGPALGAFNQWVKGTSLESWKNRYVAEIGKKIMVETAQLLNKRFNTFCTAE